MKKLFARPIIAGGFGFLLAFVLLLPAYYFLGRPAPSSITPLRQSEFRNDEYQFIDPLLSVRGSTASPGPYAPLESALKANIGAATRTGAADKVTIYFQNLNTANGLVINPDEQYSPASLLKVPVMMVYFKLAESDPSVLSRVLVYTGARDANEQEHLRSPNQLERGASYSVEKLIECMIRYSDNNAAELLMSNLNDRAGGYDALGRLFLDLGIAKIDLTNDFITVRAYSLFFRVLYNATYLNRAYSEKALELLSKTDFTAGLQAGMSQNVPVAEKFGEFSLQTMDGVVLRRELHNCGIVYYPDHPYLLCVMTKGADFTKLEDLIAHMSRTVYQFQEKLYPAS